MNFKVFRFWPYFIVAALLSFIFIYFLSVLSPSGKGALVGLSGVIIAASWSYLSIETNKEIRRRDEVIRFINEYEETVFSFLDKTRMFIRLQNDLELFFLKNKESRDKKERLELGVVVNSLIDQRNLCIYESNAIALRGRVLKKCLNKNREFDRILNIVVGIVGDMEKTYDIDNINEEEVYRYIKSEDLVEVQYYLTLIVFEKAKGFEESSSLYVERFNLGLFFIFFGAFIALWNYIGLSV